MAIDWYYSGFPDVPQIRPISAPPRRVNRSFNNLLNTWLNRYGVLGMFVVRGVSFSENKFFLKFYRKMTDFTKDAFFCTFAVFYTEMSVKANSSGQNSVFFQVTHTPA